MISFPPVAAKMSLPSLEEVALLRQSLLQMQSMHTLIIIMQPVSYQQLKLIIIIIIFVGVEPLLIM